MEIKKMIAKSNCYIGQNNPAYVVVHETDNWNRGANANAHARAMANGNLAGTVHFYVDSGECYQTLDYEDGAWAVGDGKGAYGITNKNSINIEICVNPESDYYKAVDNCAWLCAKLLKDRGWGTDRLKRHYDASRKHCPRRILDEGLWPSFVSKVQAYMGGSAVEQPKPTAVKYYVRKDFATGYSEANQKGAFNDLNNAKDCVNKNPGFYVFDASGKKVYPEDKPAATPQAPAATKTQASAFKGLSETEAAAKCLDMCRQDAKKSGIFASVSAAQMILESGYVKTGLAQEANNCFGMKTSLSGNTWPGSSWDGKSKVSRETKEQKTDGTEYTITADFRKYPCIEDSVADHSAYLLGAKNGSALRYAGITQAANYKEQITLIKNGGYATDVKYVDKICSIVERFGLDKYDKETGETQTVTSDVDTSVTGTLTVTYTGSDGVEVHTTPAWGDGNIDREHGPVGPATGKGTKFTVVGRVKVEGGYMYKLKSGLYITASEKYVSLNAPEATQTASKFPYKVKVTCDVLNIRTGAGTGYAKAGAITDHGVYNIIEEKEGKGASVWGRLKSGAGWISLDYVKRV